MSYRGKSRVPWAAVVALVLLGFLGVSVAAHSETYNFYFGKKKGEGEEPNEAMGPPAPPPAVPAPVVINNTNNVGVPAAVTTNNVGVTAPVVASPSTPVVPVVPAPSVAATPVAPVTAEAVYRPYERSRWHVALTGLAFLQKFSHLHVYNGKVETYHSHDPTWGGLLSLGYNFNRNFGFNLYGGARVASALNDKTFYHLGLDLEFMPFHIAISEKVDLLEIGLIFGGSTALASAGNSGTFHAGARVNVNFTPEFGLTTSARANLGYVAFEAGLVARL